MKIALVSLNQYWLDKERNYEQCQQYVAAAADQHCELVIFPEMTLTGFAPGHPDVVEERLSSSTLEWFGELSRMHQIPVLFGASLIEKRGEKPFNSICMSDSLGNVEQLYSKIHLFSYAQEEQFFEAGEAPGVAEISEIKMGLSICYDLRFPEIFSMQAEKCPVFINIASWPEPRIEHWYALLKARAIENRAMMIGVNRVGFDGNQLNYPASSRIFDPNGEQLKVEYSYQDLDIYSFELDQLNKMREAFDVLKDKRFSLYAEVVNHVGRSGVT